MFITWVSSWAVQKSDQQEVAEIVHHQYALTGPILEDVNPNLLLWWTQHIMWHERLLLLAGFHQLAYIASLDVFLEVPSYTWPVYAFSGSA